MFEVEAKVPVADLDAVRAELARLGAVPAGAGVEADTFFQHPGRDFASTDEALRLRDRDGALELTYKGPRHSGDTKIREEWNVPVAADPTPLLQALGFQPSVQLRKHRESWDLGDGVHASLDTLEGLGTFVEVEVVVVDQHGASARVSAALALLGLADQVQTTESYLEMALRSGASAAQPRP